MGHNRTYARGHYRRRKKPRNKNQQGNKSSTCSFQLAIGIVLLLGCLYIFSNIPSYIYSILGWIILLIVLIILTFGVAFVVGRYQRRHQKVKIQQPTLTPQPSMFTSSDVALQDHDHRQQERKYELSGRITTLGTILTTTPTDFEELIVLVLEELGYTQVQRVGKSGDLGMDVTVLDTQGKRVMVQCKKYAPGRSIGTPDLQKFLGMMVIHHKADKGIYVTISTFTQQARELAKQHKDTLTLIDGDTLMQLLHHLSRTILYPLLKTVKSIVFTILTPTIFPLLFLLFIILQWTYRERVDPDPLLWKDQSTKPWH